MKLVKNQKHSMILMKIFIFIGESKIHAGLCPFHHRKWHVFDGFGVKYMNFFDVLCPWVAWIGSIDCHKTISALHALCKKKLDELFT